MAGKTTSGVDVRTRTKSGSRVNYQLLVIGAVAFVAILAMGMIFVNSLSGGSDAGEKDQKIPDKPNRVDPVSGGVIGAGGVSGGEILQDELDINDATVENKKKEIKVYNKELYMTDISLSDSVAEFYIENRDNSYKSAWFRMQILYSFETPDGELKQGGTYIPINQEKVDIAPGAKVKFTVDVREILSSRMGYIGMKDFQIVQLEKC